jgi:hypothetical protein
MPRAGRCNLLAAEHIPKSGDFLVRKQVAFVSAAARIIRHSGFSYRGQQVPFTQPSAWQVEIPA